MGSYIIYAFILILLLLAYYVLRIEPLRLKTVRCILHEGTDSLKLLQLSDLHLYDLKVRLEDINKVIRTESPDVIALTGDMIKNAEDLVNLDNFLTSLEYPCPVCIILGNHDMDVVNTLDDIENLRKLLGKFPDICLLHNETFHLKKQSREFNIIGLADLQSGFYSAETANALISEAHGVKIVLAHNPDTACGIRPGSSHCIISGHLHGGQIWLPFNFEFTVLRNDCLPKKGYKKGLYMVHGNRLYISGGIGTSLIPARFLSRPEITVIQL